MVQVFHAKEKARQKTGLMVYNGGMRTIVTGQIGMDKKPYLEKVQQLAGERGGNIEIFNIGEMMYEAVSYTHLTLPTIYSV